MFSIEERILAWIPRWSLMPVNRRQNVAEHSFFVAHYVECLMHFHPYHSWDPEMKLTAIQHALRHDMAEHLISDIPGPVKRAVANQDLLTGLEAVAMERLSLPPINHLEPEIKLLIKAADMIDEYIYLGMEVAGGNHLVLTQRNNCAARLQRRLDAAGLGDLSIVKNIEAKLTLAHRYAGAEGLARD